MLSTASTTDLIRTGFTDFSEAALIILGFMMTIVVGLLVFYWGLKKLFSVVGSDFMFDSSYEDSFDDEGGRFSMRKRKRIFGGGYERTYDGVHWRSYDGHGDR